MHVLEILEHDLCLKKALSLENLLGGHIQCGTKHAVASRPHAFHQESASILLRYAVNFPLSTFLPLTSMITRIYMSRAELFTAFCSQVGQEEVLHMYCIEEEAGCPCKRTALQMHRPRYNSWIVSNGLLLLRATLVLTGQ